jgi:hypothetical protein
MTFLELFTGTAWTGIVTARLSMGESPIVLLRQHDLISGMARLYQCSHCLHCRIDVSKKMIKSGT